MKKTALKFKSIVLSDIHLGAPDCQVEKVNLFLKHTYSPLLILNGDIIDGWSLKRQGGWNLKHTRTIRLLLKKMEKKNTEIVYLRGNHDDFLEAYLPVSFENFRIVEQYVLDTGRCRYLLVHGDVFDAITQNSKWLAVVGDIGYQTLLRLNRLYNRYREWRGKEYFSLSKAVKAKVKSAVNYISSFEEQVQHLARKHQCQGIICGHIHTPADKMIGGIHYLNSGDWVESNTALVEHFDGRWEILDYNEFEKRLQNEAERRQHLQSEQLDIVVPVEEDDLPAAVPELVQASASAPSAAMGA